MTAGSLPQGGRGYELLLEHCAALTPRPRTPACERLERALGGDLTRLLVLALAHGGAGRVSV